MVHGLYQGLGHLRDIPFPKPARVLVLDLAGYGEHAGTGAPATIGAQVEHVVAEMDRGGIERATLVGHSVGGAVAMLLAASHPGRVAAVVNVEGNFRMADGFWSSKWAAMTPEEAEAMLAGFRSDPSAWMAAQRIESSPARVEWARRMFEAQPASSVQALARAVVAETSRGEYLQTLEGVLASGVPVHLFAGERSRAGWSVPKAFVERAATFTTQPRAGHMMPIEAPDQFLALLAGLIH